MSDRSVPGRVALLGLVAALTSACGVEGAPALAAGGQAGANQQASGAGPVAGSVGSPGGAVGVAGGGATSAAGTGQGSGGALSGVAGSDPAGAGGGGVSAGGAGGVPSLVPDPASGGWQLNEYSMIVEGALELTPGRDDTDGHERGTAFWPTPLASEGLHVEFDVDITPRKDQGDGLTLALADPAAGAQITDFGDSGGGLGYAAAPCCPGIKGIAIAVDTSKNANDPSGNFLGVATGGQIDKITWAATVTEGIPVWVDTPHHIAVTLTAGSVVVSVDGAEVLRTTAGTPSVAANVLLGFTGANGTGKSRQLVKNVVVSRL